MHTGRPLQGVIFDLDGTLYTLSAVKLRLSLSLWRSISVLRHLANARSLVRRRAFDSREELAEVFYEELGRRAGVTQDEAKKWYEQDFARAFETVLEQSATVRPGLVPLLEGLRARGIRLSVVSDFGRIPERLRALGLSPSLFDLLLPAEHSGALKPWPRSLLQVADSWGIQPESILVVGDRGDRDGDAARAAHMPFLGITGGVPWGKKHKGFVPWDRACKYLDDCTTIRSV